MDRAEKHEFVATLHQWFKGAGSIVVAHYAGLNVADMSKLRSAMKEQGGTLKVVKNRLAKLAIKGTDVEHISELFQGQTLVAYSQDPIIAPKLTVDFAKKNEKLVILGGAMGTDHLDQTRVRALAALPSLDELRARLIGTVSTPATRIVRLTGAPAGQLARCIGAYARQNEAA